MSQRVKGRTEAAGNEGRKGGSGQQQVSEEDTRGGYQSMPGGRARYSMQSERAPTPIGWKGIKTAQRCQGLKGCPGTRVFHVKNCAQCNPRNGRAAAAAALGGGGAG